MSDPSFALPRLPAEPCRAPAGLIDGLGCEPRQVLRAANYLCVFASESEVAALRPDLRALADLHPCAVIATAPGTDCDFVSRFFAPSFGIDEDPVTGSAHCTLVPFWSERLGRRRLRARQLSKRGGEISATLTTTHVVLEGACTLFLQGNILLADTLPGR